MTLAQLDVVHLCADQDDIEAFFHELQKFCLNDIAKPFWSDWVLADPDWFFTPESLHIIYKKFWDHDAQWLILAVGESEIDFCFSILQPTTGYQHFHEGISKLKQVTVIDNWYIPKLKLMQSIVPSIHSSGITEQWSADVTEHVHIMEIKDPTRSSNNNNYDPQICHHLDCVDKCNWFKLMTSLLDCKPGTEELQGIGEEFAVEDDESDQREIGSVPVPLHTFVVIQTAFYLAYNSSIKSVTLDEVAIKFGLPDLRPAMADFLHHEVQVWFKIHLQETEFHDIHSICPAQTLNCAPPSNPWTLGCYDNVIIQTSEEHSWPVIPLQRSD
ncbi:uncharacterized protein BJ212DRAFT_1304387 [Suillus subaureus]|uniref:DUF6830 domain-containing protein n=1 Tax=Suillus subaureus TaxID=48587 RepID=A0A9P7DVU0_9AGAM|nr:uncharacterized protein BJ212DRAFT_1304387 [Suillus subaureus]KAG1804171.1 hypothetical protein BJ212DRAFT_1304387 [Suillus subaureus]